MYNLINTFSFWIFFFFFLFVQGKLYIHVIQQKKRTGFCLSMLNFHPQLNITRTEIIEKKVAKFLAKYLLWPKTMKG